ncbi:MAG TPA: hypothetical protein VGH83_09450 [Candidatus Acidoferrum sp.]|jgi:hypothetical protein
MADSDKPSENGEGILNSVAEGIGATLGKLVAKANAAQKSLGETATAVVRQATPKPKPRKAATPRKKTASRPVRKRIAKPVGTVRKAKGRAGSPTRKSSKSRKNPRK